MLLKSTLVRFFFAVVAMAWGSWSAPIVLAADSIELDPRCQPLPTDVLGPFVNLADGGVLAVDGNGVIISTDDGKTWSERRLVIPADKNMAIRPERAILRTRDGAIVLVFLDNKSFSAKWKPADEETLAKNRLNVWSVRSLDEGKTWTDLQLIQEGYCGAIRDMMQTKDGALVVTSQILLPKFNRNATLPLISADDGKTWKPTNLIDIGGNGNHDGCFEAAVFEQQDGRLRLLMRTNLGRFWNGFSDDGGYSWRTVGPSDIAASSSPAIVKRLASGRLVLLWNRLHPEDTPAAKHAWFRKELSMSFSEDDGNNWTKPVVIAEALKGIVAYPYLLERRPGELWITTMQGKLRIKLYEKDFVGSKPRLSAQP